ncbi:hypothetical protein R8510_04050 [Ralstonia chuxiongensis]|nr:hypothetical protein R8510_04050 [Ralstonia chuxiongensis]
MDGKLVKPCGDPGHRRLLSDAFKFLAGSDWHGAERLRRVHNVCIAGLG